MVENMNAVNVSRTGEFDTTARFRVENKRSRHGLWPRLIESEEDTGKANKCLEACRLTLGP